ncbi:MAG: Gfo/Idh/MocA family oxidoreductase [Chloroflexota bacterium]|nr:Gfo/Idh/MocA family oxidoreductase [Chloroflexota bacterium]
MKVIQCGLGGMGRQWINTVLASPEVEFAALVEPDAATAQKRASEYELDPALIFPSLAAALAAVKADGVIDVTPPAAHKAVSFAAMEAGLPVLSEKPLAGTREDARAIVAKSDQTGVLHMITQNYRYSPLAQTVKAALDAGDLGAVGAVGVSFFKGPHFGGFREEMPYPLIIDMSIHHFDMLRFFLDANPVSIYGKSWNPAWSWYQGDASAAISATFDNGAQINYTGSWCSQGQETTWNADWRFECANGVLTVEDDQVYVQHMLGIEDRGGYRHVQNDVKTNVPLVTMERQAQAYLLYEFYQAVTTGKAPGTPCQDNIKTVEFVFDVVQSFETGAPVTR